MSTPSQRKQKVKLPVSVDVLALHSLTSSCACSGQDHQCSLKYLVKGKNMGLVDCCIHKEGVDNAALDLKDEAKWSTFCR